MLRIGLVLLGVVAVVVGAVFAAQGAGLLPGSFMTGAKSWLAIGVVMVVVGAALIVLVLRRRAER